MSMSKKIIKEAAEGMHSKSKKVREESAEILRQDQLQKNREAAAAKVSKR